MEDKYIYVDNFGCQVHFEGYDHEERSCSCSITREPDEDAGFSDKNVSRIPSEKWEEYRYGEE